MPSVGENNAQAFSILRYEESGYRVEDIEAFIRNLEKDFVPALGTRTELRVYAEKLVREAVVFVAQNVEAGDLQGMIGFYSTPEAFNTASISFLAVARPARRRGVGKRLLTCCIEYARQAGMNAIETRTWTSNTAGIQLYLSQGFEVVEQVADRGEGNTSVKIRLNLVSLKAAVG